MAYNWMVGIGKSEEALATLKAGLEANPNRCGHHMLLNLSTSNQSIVMSSTSRWPKHWKSRRSMSRSTNYIQISSQRFVLNSLLSTKPRRPESPSNLLTRMNGTKTNQHSRPNRPNPQRTKPAMLQDYRKNLLSDGRNMVWSTSCTCGLHGVSRVRPLSAPSSLEQGRTYSHPGKSTRPAP